MYDGILRLPLVGRSEIVGFSEDLALLVVDKHPGKADEKCNINIMAIEQWLSSMGLELAPEKKEAVLISSRKAVETAPVSSSRTIKYMEVMIDTRLSKAAGVNRALSTIMLNIRGPKQASRRRLTSVTRATMIYAVPVWAKGLERESYAKGLNALSALRICYAFRTVPNETQENKVVFNQTHSRSLFPCAKR